MAIASSVGKLSIRILPDSTGFAQDLKADLRRLKAAADATLKVKIEPDFSASTFSAKLREQLRRLDTTTQQKVTLDAELSGAAMARVRREIASMTGDVEIGLDTRGVVRDAREARDDAERVLRGMDKVKATLGVDVDAGAARASLALLQRARIVPLIVNLDKTSMARAATAMARLGGTRILGDALTNVKDFALNLDRVAASALKAAPAIASLGALGLAGLGGAAQSLVAFSSAITATLPAAAALPGILTGVSLSFVGLGVSIGRAATEMGDTFAESFSRMKQSISDASWEQLAAPLENLAQSVLPVLETNMSALGTAAGKFLGAIADAASSSSALSDLSSIVQDAAAGMEQLAPGAASFTSAILSVSQVGASLLPSLATAISDVASDFADWARASADSGEMLEWINGGVAALKQLGGILADMGGIVAGVFRAMGASGDAEAVTAFAVALDNINKAVNGPAFQGALNALFDGAALAAGNLGPMFDALGDAFVTLVPTLNTIMYVATEAIGTLGEAFAELLQDEAFTDGLVAMFKGLAAGVSALAPAMGALAPVAEALGAVLGAMGEEIGTVLAEAVTQLAPVFVELLDALLPLIPILGGLLVEAISTLAPILMDLVQQFASWAKENPELVSTIIAIVAVVAPLISGLIAIISAIAPIISAVAALWPLFAALGAAIAGISAPVLIVIGVLAALVVGFIAAWNYVDGFKEAVIGMWEGIKNLPGQIGGWFSSAVGGVATFLTNLWTSITEFFIDLPNKMMEIGRDLVEGLKNGISSAAGSVWDALTGLADGAVTTVKDVLGIHSPSVVFREIGSYTGQGMVRGIDDEATAVQRAMGSMVAPPSVGEVDVPAGSAAFSGGGNITNIYYPQAERRSELNRRDANIIAEGY